MPRPTIAEVSARCDVLEERSTTRHAEIKELFKDDEKLLEEIKTLRVDVTELQKDNALLRQRVDEHLKRVEVGHAVLGLDRGACGRVAVVVRRADCGACQEVTVGDEHEPFLQHESARRSSPVEG